MKNDASVPRVPIRIAVLLQDLEFGGTQRYAIHLLKYMDKEVFSPELWVLRQGEDMVPIAAKTGVRIIHLSRSSRVGPRAISNLAWRLIRMRPDGLYTLTVVPNIWGRILGRIAGVPVIISGYRSLFPKQHERWLWRLANRIICNAEALKGVMIRRFSVDPDRIAVIPNAVDTALFQSTQSFKAAEPTVLCVGRLVKEKDPLNLLEGFRIVSDKIPNALFRIIGNGPLKQEVQARIKALSLDSRVELLPGTPDLVPHLARSWVFVLASAMEASPNVILEAMAMELPVVATSVGGIPELVQDGKTGLLVRPGDPEDLASALVKVLTDEPGRHAMGRAARERVLANHSLENMVRQTERVFSEAFEEVSAKS
ncbi:MAG: glycosyltransferase [Desulfomonile tiedjei]|nr:glycosyltransferase [Desulfomonile tiedjei]